MNDFTRCTLTSMLVVVDALNDLFVMSANSMFLNDLIWLFVLINSSCSLFLHQKKEKIALFVGLENRAANVYGRVGFMGIGKEAVPTEGVDTWVELGFDTRYVTLGHW